MKKLKKVITKYSNWSILTIYLDRIETHIEIDFSHSVENAKALLETIGKEICDKNGRELSPSSSINSVLKNAFSSMGFTNTSLVNQISSALATIAQQVGVLRNEIGISSHGKPLEEISKRNSRIDKLTREFLIDTVETISIFLIRNFELIKEKSKGEESINYRDAILFNDSWDDSFGEFTMGEYSYFASEILYNVDKQAYIAEYKIFSEFEE